MGLACKPDCRPGQGEDTRGADGDQNGEQPWRKTRPRAHLRGLPAELKAARATQVGEKSRNRHDEGKYREQPGIPLKH